MNNYNFFIYLAVMAGVTYLVRMLPLVLIKRKIKNMFLLSFLHYIPYAVLCAMTVPAFLFSTGSIYTAIAGFIVALVLSYFEKSLTTVAIGATLAVFAAEMVAIHIAPLF